MKGEWILKEVYFEDGWPSVMRDPVRPEQEPVAWYDKHGMVTHDVFEGITPLYKSPRPWVTPDDRGSTGEVPGKYRGS